MLLDYVDTAIVWQSVIVAFVLWLSGSRGVSEVWWIKDTSLVWVQLGIFAVLLVPIPLLSIKAKIPKKLALKKKIKNLAGFIPVLVFFAHIKALSIKTAISHPQFDENPTYIYNGRRTITAIVSKLPKFLTQTIKLGHILLPFCPSCPPTGVKFMPDMTVCYKDLHHAT